MMPVKPAGGAGGEVDRLSLALFSQRGSLGRDVDIISFESV
jgi:hypothetical protein